MYATDKIQGNSNAATNQLNINQSGHKATIKDAIKNKKAVPHGPAAK